MNLFISNKLNFSVKDIPNVYIFFVHFIVTFTMNKKLKNSENDKRLMASGKFNASLFKNAMNVVGLLFARKIYKFLIPGRVILGVGDGGSLSTELAFELYLVLSIFDLFPDVSEGIILDVCLICGG